LFPSLSGFFGNIPIFEATVAVVLIVGAIYYLIAQRGNDMTPAMTAAPQAGD
jgi:hypothetical protein